jgi:hypothetical protein
MRSRLFPSSACRRQRRRFARRAVAALLCSPRWLGAPAAAASLRSPRGCGVALLAAAVGLAVVVAALLCSPRWLGVLAVAVSLRSPPWLGVCRRLRRRFARRGGSACRRLRCCFARRDGAGGAGLGCGAVRATMVLLGETKKTPREQSSFVRSGRAARRVRGYRESMRRSTVGPPRSLDRAARCRRAHRLPSAWPGLSSSGCPNRSCGGCGGPSR